MNPPHTPRRNRVAGVVQAIAWFIALMSINIPPGNQPLGQLILQQLAAGNPAAQQVGATLDAIRQWDRQILGGAGPFDPVAAAAIMVASLMSLGLLWVSRWFDGHRGEPTAIEQLLAATVPPGLVVMALVSPATALAMAAAQIVFDYFYPGRRVYLVVPKPNGQFEVIRAQ